MPDLFPTTLDDQIEELSREVKMRRRVYPRFVTSGTLSQAKADRQIAAMEAAIESLHRLKGLEK